MAHSFIDFRGKWLHWRDADVTMFVYLVLDAARDEEASYTPQVKRLLDRWATVLDCSAPGAMTLDLDEHLVSEIDVQTLTALLDRVDRKLQAFGDPVPGWFLTDLVGSPSFHYEDQPVESVTKLVTSFRGLLAGTAGEAGHTAEQNIPD